MLILFCYVSELAYSLCKPNCPYILRNSQMLRNTQQKYDITFYSNTITKLKYIDKIDTGIFQIKEAKILFTPYIIRLKFSEWLSEFSLFDLQLTNIFKKIFILNVFILGYYNLTTKNVFCLTFLRMISVARLIFSFNLEITFRADNSGLQLRVDSNK